MNEQHINAFSQLGEELRIFGNPEVENGILGERLNENMLQVFYENGWFTEDNVKQALNGISTWLKEDLLKSWTSKYQSKGGKSIGIIMAGNIPLVGFHDMMSVLLSGHKALIKMSSNDKILLPILLKRLIEIEPSLKSQFEFVERLKEYDAVIATGSNNSARYFEYYFKNKPNIIRKNRNSMAVLNGKESEESLVELGKDIFQFYGLGCRNVSKVLIPEDFDLNRLFKGLVVYSDIVVNNKYSNNYDYYKAFYMLNKADLLENGFFLLKEDSSLHSPVAMLFYQRYQTDEEMKQILKIEEENLQCIVSEHPEIKEAIPFGTSQCPSLTDYADGVDTMEFLAEL